MNKIRTYIIPLAMGTCLAMMSAGPVVADDTELFFSKPAPSNSTQPNILFILDTSGSMGTTLLTREPWDPTQTYTGCYDSNAIYYSGGTKPDCTSLKSFPKSVNHCEASWSALDGLGQYRDEFSAWRQDLQQWENLSVTDPNRPTECQADYGSHGDGSSNLDVYPANGSQGPWHDDTSAYAAFTTTHVVFDGNWLNWSETAPSVSKTRIEVVKEAALQLADNFQNINIGLQRFNYDEGGGIIDAIEDINTGRADFKAKVSATVADGNTPLSEVLYEAGLYFAGGTVDYGNIADPDPSAPETRVGGTGTSNTYLSPITIDCQKNYIIFLTDGEPTQDSSADAKIAALPGFDTLVGSSCDGSGVGHCLDDMAEYLNKADLSPLPGRQWVSTYTVGFLADFPLLLSTAQRGGGQYRTADDAASLISVLSEIFQDISGDATTFTAPAVPVNAFNRTTNLQDVFISMFKPAPNVHWPGNVKKYRLVGGQLVGQDTQPAVDTATGFVKPDAFSYWSDAVDGNNVVLGGAAHEIPDHTLRNLYTNVSGPLLTDPDNSIETGNAVITAAMLGSPAGDRNIVINHARGLDVFDEDDDGDKTDTRHVMGDPLHSGPVTVIYGGTAANPDTVLFTATNDGFVHAINASDGSELWAFVPQQQLSRMHALYVNDLAAQKQYGVDGEIAVYIRNDDKIPGIDPTVEDVILLFGMRRGGNAVFALNVTDRTNPQLEWVVDANTPGFENMGQSWSTPKVAKVNIGGNETTVAVFGGGYDPIQDGPAYRVDTRGNSIYMVNLEPGTNAGNLEWSAGHPTVGSANYDVTFSQMQHSIPAGINVIDITQDGLADRMYVGDMGGRVWRFDIVNGNPAGTLVEGGVLASLGAADLGASPPASQVRRFYATPDIVPVVYQDVGEEKMFLTVNLGSGYRAHPLNSTIEDEFFSIRDFNVFGVVATADYGLPVYRNDLIDITDLGTPGDPADPEPVVLPTDPGWRLSMQGPGEKILSEAFAFDNEVFFVSFSPQGTSSSCSATTGKNRLYRVSVFNGFPVRNLDGSPAGDDLTETDRYINLEQGGIAPEPTFLFPEDLGGKPIICIGLECQPPGFDPDAVRTYWIQDEAR